MSSSSTPRIQVSSRDRDWQIIAYFIGVITIFLFLYTVAMREYKEVAYARTVIGDLPLYIGFVAIIIVLFLAAWITTRTKRTTETYGTWYYG